MPLGPPPWVIPGAPLPVVPLLADPVPEGPLPEGKALPLPGLVGPEPIVLPDVPPPDELRLLVPVWPRCCDVLPVAPDPVADVPLPDAVPDAVPDVPLVVLPLLPMELPVPLVPEPVWAMATPPKRRAAAETHKFFAIDIMFSSKLVLPKAPLGGSAVAARAVMAGRIAFGDIRTTCPAGSAPQGPCH